MTTVKSPYEQVTDNAHGVAQEALKRAVAHVRACDGPGSTTAEAAWIAAYMTVFAASYAAQIAAWKR